MEVDNTVNPPHPSEKKPPKILRILRSFVIFFFFLFVIIAGGIFIIGYYYQNEVKDLVVAELNKKLNTKIIIEGKDIDFTVLKNFPYASVDFKNVKALDANESNKKDTLFKAGKISFQFNIVDVFKKKYGIQKLKIDDVDLKISIDKNGNDNYHFWKPNSDTGTTAFSFELEKIILTKIRLSYTDYKAKQNFDVLIKKSILSGKFSNQKYSLETTSDFFMNQIIINKTTFLRKKNIHAELDLFVDNTMPSYKIKNGKIKIENLLFELFGNVITANDQPIVNIGIRGKNMDIKSVLSLIPNQYKGRITDYESTGEFYFDATVKGSVTKNKVPQINAEFGIKNASITQVKDNIVLHNVNLKGRYSNGNKANSENSLLELDKFSATINKDSISGELNLRNLDKPTVSAKIKANMRLEEIQKFIKIDTIETISGQLKIDVSFTGDEKEFNSTNYQNITTSGSLMLSNTNIKLKNNALIFANINGDFNFNNNDLGVNGLTGNVSSSDFELKGFFRNCVSYILKKNQDITVEATLVSKNINLDELLANKEDNHSSKSKYKLKFSEHINVNLSSEIQHLQFRKFEAVNIRGIIKLKDKKMTVDPITFSTMNGSITTSGLVDGSDSTKLLVTCFSEVSKINISKMFIAFENFGQTAIKDKNIKGIATAKIQFASVFSPELDMDMDKLYAGIDLTVENGELNNVEAMKSLSRFIDLKELESIHFSTLKNQFEIKKQVITIPKMEIKSSAINITTSGTHTFDNKINYKIKLSLNELLAKKAKKAKKENNEFGEVADDGLGRTDLFLSMTGTVDNPIIKYDSKSAMQKIKQDLKIEKQTLKTILKEEFGLFKKDTSLKIKNKSPEEDRTKFIIKWEENDKKEEIKVLRKPKKEVEDDF